MLRNIAVSIPPERNPPSEAVIVVVASSPIAVPATEQAKVVTYSACTPCGICDDGELDVNRYTLRINGIS